MYFVIGCFAFFPLSSLFGVLLPEQVQHSEGTCRRRDEERSRQHQEGGRGGLWRRKIRQISKVSLGPH